MGSLPARDALLPLPPGGWDSFVRDHWDKEPLYVPSLLREPKRLEALLFDAAVEAGAAAAAQRRSGLRFVAGEGDRRIQSEIFLERERRPRRADRSFERFLERASDACGRRDVTLIANDCQSFDRTLYEASRELLRGLHDALGCSLFCDAVTYASRSRTTALGIHRDLVDNILYVVRGEKRFSLWSAEEEGTGAVVSSRSFASLRGKGRHVVLRPGDFLYIPRGTYHFSRQDGASVHLSITIGTDPRNIEHFLRDSLASLWTAAFAGRPGETKTSADLPRDELAALPAFLEAPLERGLGALAGAGAPARIATRVAWAVRASAGGFAHVPSMTQPARVRLTDFVRARSDRFVVAEAGPKLACAADGNLVTLPDTPLTRSLVRDLRRGETHAVRELATRHTGIVTIDGERRELDRAWLVTVLGELRRAGAIEVRSRAT